MAPESSADFLKSYLSRFKLVDALWWLIDNVEPDDPLYAELRVYLRGRYQEFKNSPEGQDLPT